jgi:dCTP deaminase
MSVLPDHELLALGEKLLTPFDPAAVQPASVDLRLGNEFITFQRDQTIAVDLDNVPKDLGKKVVVDFPPTPEDFDVDKPIGPIVPTQGRRHFVLHPGEFCLGVTLERVTIPDDLVARLEGRSSVGRLGLAIHVTAGYIDPGFRGPITLEMANLSPHPLILRPGRSICQLSVLRMSSPPRNPYRGRYQDAEGVQASRYGQFKVTGHPVTPHEHGEDALRRFSAAGMDVDELKPERRLHPETGEVYELLGIRSSSTPGYEGNHDEAFIARRGHAEPEACIMLADWQQWGRTTR